MEKCNNCEQKEACVPYFVHEGIMTHYSRANKRMFYALIISITVVVIGMISLGWMFLSSYNAREQGWQEIANRWITEVEDELHQSP